MNSPTTDEMGPMELRQRILDSVDRALIVSETCSPQIPGVLVEELNDLLRARNEYQAALTKIEAPDTPDDG